MESLVDGFGVALSAQNLLFVFLGVLLGTIIGVIPGLGPTAGIAILLPLTFGLPPETAIIMLAGVFYGSQYGGSTTSILLNLPGEATSVVTAIDGHEMAKQGRAGAALGISAIGSFIAGTCAVVGLMVVTPLLVQVALEFGPHEFFGLMLLGLTMVAYLAGGSLSKAVLMALVGLMLATIGADPVTGTTRFAFGNLNLIDGVAFLPVVTGLFAFSEVLISFGSSVSTEPIRTRFRELWPSVADVKESIGAIFRGTGIGFVLGALPGAGVLVSTFLSYGLEKRISKNPKKFGKGAIQGVAGPESANNAAAGSALVPLLALGIPSSVVTALMLGALILHGMRPGPALIADNPDFFWALVASLYIGNAVLLALNLPLVGVFASMLRVPYRILWPIIMMFSLVGVFAAGQSVFDLGVFVFFGVLGWVLRLNDYPLAPLVLAMVLGPFLERSLGQALIISNGDLLDFLRRPISAVMLGLALAVVVSSAFLFAKERRKERGGLGELLHEVHQDE
ncbi:MAG: tripartite tricarboxylate transporter permease [Acidimicrobiia bacterium]|nr:tripartite tricarboxylate transporter permease [Acidimicrobiia bacterium]